MKRIMTLVLAAGLVFGAATGASAIDFNAKGQWIFGFGAVDSAFVTKKNGKNQNTSDKFAAIQRLRLQMTAVASESLSGTVYFEIGDQTWGNGKSGAALGADGTVVEVKNAYLDWVAPNTDLKFRMGIQAVALPNVAGGSAVFDDDVAGITANYKFNDTVGLTALWMRPFNDNYVKTAAAGDRQPSNFLDNVDIFGLTLPISLEGWKVTPWAAMGFVGKNSLGVYDESLGGRKLMTNNIANGILPFGISGQNMGALGFNTRNAYSTVFFAGLPLQFTGIDPWNFELDMNYGYSQGLGRFNALDQKSGDVKRADSKTEGWLIKGLAEYKMDWGTPGLFAWYGSGDDGNVKNGSERMPTLSTCGNFTSFMGDGPERGWSIWSGNNLGYDLMLSYSGTWGVGAQIKDLTFMEGLTHTLRAAYWGGTNSPSMAKYYGATAATDSAGGAGVYLTTNDALVEFNVDSTYKIYENLTATLELGYIVNAVDKGTWNRSYKDTTFTKGDAYKAALIFNYSF